MSYQPLAFTIPQYDKVELANWWLKAYEAGTTTPLHMALDSQGDVTVARVQLNSEGFTITPTGALTIPYIDGNYDLYCFPTASEADSNDTTNALRFAQNVIVDIDEFIVSDGLDITLSSFSLSDAESNIINVSGGSVTAQPSLTQYLYLDLFDLSLKLLRRNIHTGGVLIADIQTDANSVTNIFAHRLVLPKTRIPVTLSRLRNNNTQKTIIGLVGDSLTAGAGGLPRWRNLLFDEVTIPDTWKVSSAGITNIQRNFAIGGTVVDLGLAQACRSGFAASSSFANTQVSYLGHYGLKSRDPSIAGYGTSSMLDCDCVIISYGANGGDDRHSKLESLVKTLRNNDVEVIIHTANFRSDSLDFEPIPLDIVTRIADAHGCEIADTWGYMREAQDNGDSVFSDVIHPNALGHQIYAGCIRSVLHTHAVKTEKIKSTQLVLGEASDINLENKWFSRAVGVFTPTNSSTGALLNQPAPSTTVRDEFINPAINAGNKTADTCISELGVGEWVDFGFSISGAVDLLVDESTPSTIDVSIQNGNILAETINVPDGVHLGVYRVYSHGENANISNGQPGITARSFRVTCTSGTARIVGMIFHTPEINEIPFSDMETVGTWSNEAGIIGHPEVIYSDSLNDRINIPFKGTGVQALLSNRTAAGQVNVYVDGRFVRNIDLYTTASLLFSVNEWIDTDDISFGYGDHVLTLEYVGDNPAIASTSLRNRRLSVYAAYGLDGR